MAKHRIFCVGCYLPGEAFEDVDFNSDQTLLDADVVLFEPTLGDVDSVETYNGKPLLTEHSSFEVSEKLAHWRSEIVQAVKAGNLVIVFLAKPIESYRYTGEQQFSGGSRGRAVTKLVAKVSSYDAVPHLKSFSAKTGREIQLTRDASYLSSYWAEVSGSSRYEVAIEGEISGGSTQVTCWESHCRCQSTRNIRRYTTFSSAAAIRRG